MTQSASQGEEKIYIKLKQICLQNTLQAQIQKYLQSFPSGLCQPLHPK